MKKKIMMVLVCLLLVSTGLYAADGDMNVSGNLTVGGVISFPVGTMQSTANRLVWDYTVTSAATTSVNSPTLNSISDGGYIFDFYIKNATASISIPSIITNQSLTCKSTKITIGSGVTVTGGYTANAEVNSIPASGWVELTGVISDFGAKNINYQQMRNGDLSYTSGSIYCAGVTTLNKITISMSVPNSINIGSRFRLWKRQ